MRNPLLGVELEPFKLEMPSSPRTWAFVVKWINARPTNGVITAIASLTITAGRPDVLDDAFCGALTVRDNILHYLTKLCLHGSYQFDTEFLLAMFESRVSP
jgi:hypothetical protein